MATLNDGHTMIGSIGAPFSKAKRYDAGDVLIALIVHRQQNQAREAAKIAVDMIAKLFHPDAIVLCGGVGLAPWLDLRLPNSPYRENAGLFGAAAISAFPPTF